MAAWVPAHLTDAQKADATNYRARATCSQFHQNAPGHKNGSRLVVGEGEKLPLEYADRFEVYRPGQLTLAVGDRIRVTANGKTKDGKHRLDNGALFTVQGFTQQGDLIVDHGWVIAKDFGHLAHGYVVTSHAARARRWTRCSSASQPVLPGRRTSGSSTSRRRAARSRRWSSPTTRRNCSGPCSGPTSRCRRRSSRNRQAETVAAPASAKASCVQAAACYFRANSRTTVVQLHHRHAPCSGSTTMNDER